MGKSGFQNVSVPSQGNYLEGQILAALGHSGPDSPLNAAAAGDLHADHQYIPDGIAPQNFREFFRIVSLVQLGQPMAVIRPAIKRAWKSAWEKAEQSAATSREAPS